MVLSVYLPVFDPITKCFKADLEREIRRLDHEYSKRKGREDLPENNVCSPSQFRPYSTILRIGHEVPVEGPNDKVSGDREGSNPN